MTLDNFFRDEISRGQPPLAALHNAAQAYAAELSTKEFITHGLVKELPKCRTTLCAHYDELEERLRSTGGRKYQVRYLDGSVRTVVEPEESAKQIDKDCSQYADEIQAWDEPEKSLVDEFLGTEEGRRQFAYEKLKYELEGAVELLREFIEISTIESLAVRTARLTDLLPRVLKFLEGKQ